MPEAVTSGNLAPGAVTTAAPGTRPPRRLPGVDGIWVLIGADSVIFGILFINFCHDRAGAPALFEAARRTLNSGLGGLDTLILLTSSWFVALGIKTLRGERPGRAHGYLLGGVLTGCAFVASKSVEYGEKFAAGITPATDAFYMWYFTLTGIHLVHVLVGTALLAHCWLGIRRGRYGPSSYVVPECVASFWHLVDLLWIFLFPLLYLQR